MLETVGTESQKGTGFELSLGRNQEQTDQSKKEDGKVALIR